MKVKKVLQLLDMFSFACLIVATVCVIVFEVTGIESWLMAGVILYEVCLVALIALTVTRLVLGYKSAAGSEFELSKSQKIWFFVRLVLAVAAFGLATAILCMF